jgi:hypothetical protein
VCMYVCMYVCILTEFLVQMVVMDRFAITFRHSTSQLSNRLNTNIQHVKPPITVAYSSVLMDSDFN